jgi:curved DNA-binding protein CbpA
VKDYYNTLGVSRTADSTEIKRAYRKLAVQFHPDKNPDPSVVQFFKEVNEAYDVLSDAGKKRDYDLRFQNPFYEPPIEKPRPAHRDPAYRRKRPVKPEKSERQRLFELMHQYAPYVQRLFFCCIGFCFLLLIDYSLPFKKHYDRVSEMYGVYSGRRGRDHNTDVIVLESGTELSINTNDTNKFKIGDNIEFQSSRLFGIKMKIYTSEDFYVSIPVSIYGSFVFCPIVLAMLSMVGLVSRERIELFFNLGIAAFFILLLNIAFLFIK